MLPRFSYARLWSQRSVIDEDLEKLKRLKRRLPLLDYLRQQNWSGRRADYRPEFVGLCPLHPERQPSFYLNAHKNLFYCHGESVPNWGLRIRNFEKVYFSLHNQ